MSPAMLRRRPAPAAASNLPVKQLADGFWSISGAAVAPGGKLYFVDRHFQRIHGWSDGGGLSTERDSTLDPVNLAIDDAGNVLVLSSDGAAGTVYAFKPGSSEAELVPIAPVPVGAARRRAHAAGRQLLEQRRFQDQYDARTDRFTNARLA